MTISTDAKADLYKQSTDEAFIVLITIAHTDLVPSLLVAGNSTNITSRGDEYVAYPFSVQFPSSDPDSPPRARIQIDNVDRRIVQGLRALTSAPTITFEIIRASDPDTVEISMPGFTLQSADYDALIVAGDLGVENFILEPYPAGIFSPAQFPGGF